MHKLLLKYYFSNRNSRPNPRKKNRISTRYRGRIIAEKEDRISNLPDEIIHHILSFLDMKFAMQTSALSKKWRHIWTSMPYLKFNSQMFYTLPQFAKFVKHVLSHRNQCTEVCAVDLTFTGAPNQFVVRSILNYAYSHNIRQLSVIWLTKKVLEFPQCLFRSHTLKHLTLATNEKSAIGFGQCIPTYAWDFPVLETLNLSNMHLAESRDESLNLFSKCANLKDLTLHRFAMINLDIFHICAPQLSDLTITDPIQFPTIFNVVAPQLENLTASVDAYSYWGFTNYLRLSAEGLDSLQQVNFSMSTSIYKYRKKEIDVPQLLDLFRKLSSAKVLILDTAIIEALPSCLDQLLLEPCPFNNLKCLKIDTVKQKGRIPTMPIQLINYFRESSLSVPFIMDIPKEWRTTWKSKSNSSKKSRNIHHDGVVFKHIRGSITLARHRKRLEKDSCCLVSASEIFKRTHAEASTSEIYKSEIFKKFLRLKELSKNGVVRDFFSR